MHMCSMYNSKPVTGILLKTIFYPRLVALGLPMSPKCMSHTSQLFVAEKEDVVSHSLWRKRATSIDKVIEGIN